MLYRIKGSGPGSIVVNADGTYSVGQALSAEGKSAAETAAILTGFAGTTLTGFTVDWLAVSVAGFECDATMKKPKKIRPTILILILYTNKTLNPTTTTLGSLPQANEHHPKHARKQTHNSHHLLPHRRPPLPLLSPSPSLSLSLSHSHSLSLSHSPSRSLSLSPSLFRTVIPPPRLLVPVPMSVTGTGMVVPALHIPKSMRRPADMADIVPCISSICAIEVEAILNPPAPSPAIKYQVPTHAHTGGIIEGTPASIFTFHFWPAADSSSHSPQHATPSHPRALSRIPSDGLTGHARFGEKCAIRHPRSGLRSSSSPAPVRRPPSMSLTSSSRLRPNECSSHDVIHLEWLASLPDPDCSPRRPVAR
ncbi:hypothetical protein B0H34DRAFT_801336 [Crassisporium funariophilum]|nr:hypothetical protein B0H34DRAFT_801336 [Crassisporium funariophilum]